jgi:iron complex outermembrane receptor protein
MNKNNSTGLMRRLVLPAGLILTAASAALAQEMQIQDVVVTTSETPQAFSKQQAEAFQSKPQAVTVVTERQIEALNITNLVQAMKLQPSLQIRTGNFRSVTVNIRGLGNFSNTSTHGIFGGVPVYIDGVYQTRPAQAIFDVPDLVGIEVLKGPQATGGGQDSTGGTVNLVTGLPSFVQSQSLWFLYGKYNNAKVQAQATGPFADTDWIAYRVSFLTEDRDGYIQNNNTPTRYHDWHSKGARVQFLLRPTENLSARLVLDYSHVNNACCLSLFDGVAFTRANGARLANNFYERAARIGYRPIRGDAVTLYRTDILGYQANGSASYGAAGIVDFDLIGLAFKSISAFRGFEYDPGNSSGFADTTFNNGHVLERSFEQEFKMTTPAGEPVEATAGVFVLYEQLNEYQLAYLGSQAGAWLAPNAAQASFYSTALNGLNKTGHAILHSNEIAPYAQAVWHATPEFDVIAGLRYSHYAKDAWFGSYYWRQPDISRLSAADQVRALALQQAQLPSGLTATPSVNQGVVSALASATYEFAPAVLGYVTYARGGRAGGPNVPNPSGDLPPGTPFTVQPEEVDAYEFGVKSTWLDNRLLANFATFLMVDHNYITTITDLTGAQPQSYLANAKRVISRGVELDLRAYPSDNLFFYGSFTYNHAYYASFDSAPCPFEFANVNRSCNFTGQRVSLVPLWAFAVGGEYAVPLGTPFEPIPKPVLGYVGADFAYQTSFYSDTSNSFYSKINPYGLLNVRAGLRFDDASLDVFGWVNNALDERYYTSKNAPSAGAGGSYTVGLGVPLTAGVTIRSRF